MNGRATCTDVRIFVAGVAELADAPDLGSGVYDVKVQVLSPAPSFLKLFLVKLNTRFLS